MGLFMAVISRRILRRLRRGHEKFVIINLKIPPVLVNKNIINGIKISSPDEIDVELLV